jgi:hypothetical protein
MKALQRPARVAAVVSAIAAVGAGTMIAVGTASAAEPAKCVENVNVREQPRIDSKVIALCEAGTTVEAGEIRNGFVRLTDLGGWSAQEYISINGQKPVKPTSTAGALDDEEGTRTGRSGSTEDAGTATSPRSSRAGSTEDADPAGTPRSSRAGGTGGSTDEAADDTPGDRSESRTNGKVDEDEEKGAAAKPKPAPAAPAKPGAGLLPGL